MHIVATIILVVWVAFWISWLAAAVGVKQGHSRWRQFAGIRIAIVLLVLLLLRAKVFKAQAVTSDPLLQGIGLAIFVAGLALAVWARLYIGRNWALPMSEKVGPRSS